MNAVLFVVGIGRISNLSATAFYATFTMDDELIQATTFSRIVGRNAFSYFLTEPFATILSNTYGTQHFIYICTTVTIRLEFSFDLLKKRGISTQGLVGSFEKLASLDGGRTQSMFDSHPPSTERAQHIRDRIASGK